MNSFLYYYTILYQMHRCERKRRFYEAMLRRAIEKLPLFEPIPGVCAV